jgi:hypothetical protein
VNCNSLMCNKRGINSGFVRWLKKMKGLYNPATLEGRFILSQYFLDKAGKVQYNVKPIAEWKSHSQYATWQKLGVRKV